MASMRAIREALAAITPLILSRRGMRSIDEPLFSNLSYGLCALSKTGSGFATSLNSIASYFFICVSSQLVVLPLPVQLSRRYHGCAIVTPDGGFLTTPDGQFQSKSSGYIYVYLQEVHGSIEKCRRLLVANEEDMADNECF